MAVEEIVKNPTLHNGTLTKASKAVVKSNSKLAYIVSYGCI